MHDLSYPSTVILAPPFLSHFSPLLAIGKALASMATDVTVGCTVAFMQEVEDAGLTFTEVEINRNTNRGVATRTRQDKEERRRLDEFLHATERGPVETLITQSGHRAADMFANPEELIERIRQIDHEIHPSLWIVDQLSYGVTLALYGLKLPFITFCAPHPASIPSPDAIYGVPPGWPSCLTPPESELTRLRVAALSMEKSFTEKFNRLLASHFGLDPVESAFRVHSPKAVVFNYPPFPIVPTTLGGAFTISGGHTVQPQQLPKKWELNLADSTMLVIVAFGTFLGSRRDVISTTVGALRRKLPEATIVVGAGGSSTSLAGQFDDRVIVEPFIPQRALLERANLVVHHGGVSSFTESLHSGTPMIVMPFSSDQFSVARDVETLKLGGVLDPNGVDVGSMAGAVDLALGTNAADALAQWSKVVRRRGPEFVAREIQNAGDIR